jgi:FkbM family methyltransferase
MNVEPNAESQARWQDEDGERLRYVYDLRPKDVVIDLGAYRGEWAAEIQSRYGCQMIVVEPTHSIVGFPAEVINKAISDHDGRLEFGGAYYYTSRFEPAHQTFECFDAKDLFNRFDEIALVKVNIEGDEYDLMDYLISLNLHLRVRDWQIQFHEVSDMDFQARYYRIIQRLSESHHLTYHYSYCWENWKRNA